MVWVFACGSAAVIAAMRGHRRHALALSALTALVIVILLAQRSSSPLAISL